MNYIVIILSIFYLMAITSSVITFFIALLALARYMKNKSYKVLEVVAVISSIPMILWGLLWVWAR